MFTSRVIKCLEKLKQQVFQHLNPGHSDMSLMNIVDIDVILRARSFDQAGRRAKAKEQGGEVL